MRSLLKESMELGYVKRENYTENGLRRWRYEISDWPEFKKCLPCVDKPRLGGQGLDNERCIQDTNTTSLRSVVSKKNQSKESPSIAPKGTRETSPKNLYGEHVKYSDEEYEKLVSAHGESLVQEIIEDINNFITAHGKKPYKDYCGAFRTFLKNRKAKESKKPSNEASFETNAALAKKVKEKFHWNKDIELGPSYIEFGRYPAIKHFSFKEHGFREQILGYFRKCDYPVEGL